MKVYYPTDSAMPLMGHRFPSAKYPQLLQKARQAHQTLGVELFAADPVSEEQLLSIHTPDYVTRVLSGDVSEREMRRIGFPWSAQLIERARRTIGGTMAACRAALQDGISANLSGGYHHAYPDHGEGYCIFNDVAIAIREIQKDHLAKKFVIIDCDVHQGNGTAAIFAEEPAVFTFSIHGERNFPFHKEQSDLDIALSDQTGDEEYLAALAVGVQQSLELAQADLAIYIAGADPYREDRLGRMALSKAGIAERDRFVLDSCYRNHLPVAIVMGGGYARNVEDIVDIHLNTIQTASQLASSTCNFSPLLP